MRGPEGKIQDAVIKYARTKYDALCKKNEVGRFMVSSGWPDYMLIGSTESSIVFIEFKAPGGKLTDLQEHLREQLEERGFKYYVISDVAEGKKIIDREFK